MDNCLVVRNGVEMLGCYLCNAVTPLQMNYVNYWKYFDRAKQGGIYS